MNKIKKLFSLLLGICVLGCISANTVNAIDNLNTKSIEEKQEVFEGVIEKINKEELREVMGRKQNYQEMKVFVTTGSLKGKVVTIENGNLPIINIQDYNVGDEIKFSSSKDPEFGTFYYITDYIRRNTLLKLFTLFVIVVIVVAGIRGLTSIVGMGISLIIIVQFILPQILSGKNPLLISIIGCIMIVPITFSLSHGINRKTAAAVIGTVISLCISGILANLFIGASKISGFASEEAGYLQVYMGGNLDIRGLLLAGIIIGVLGVLDDITVSQSAIVFQIKDAVGKISKYELYRRAMNIGKDHISSMVNTLMLVYTGAALPLLLIFSRSQEPYHQIVDYEIVAEEVVRTLVGSIGLVIAVPITTIIACLMLPAIGVLNKSKKQQQEQSYKSRKE